MEKLPLPDFLEIKNQVSCEALLNSRGLLDRLIKKGSKWTGPSPFRKESDGKTSFNLDTARGRGGAFFDHGVGHGGSVLELAACLEHGAEFFLFNDAEKKRILVEVARKLEQEFGLVAPEIKKWSKAGGQVKNLQTQTKETVQEAVRDSASPSPSTQVNDTEADSQQLEKEANTEALTEPLSVAQELQADISPKVFEGFKPLPFSLTLQTDHPKYLEFLENRGFTPEDLAPFHAGYFENTKRKGIMHRRITFPLYHLSEGWMVLVGYTGRALEEEDLRQHGKWRLPHHFEKSHYLYGTWVLCQERLAKGEPVYLVEGVLDAVAVHKAGGMALALLGCTLTPDQCTLLHSLGIQEVHVLFDGDPSGQEASLQAGTSLFKAGFTVRQITLPPGLDPADCSVEELRECLKRN